MSGEISEGNKAISQDKAPQQATPSVWGDMWQSAKYSGIQKPYEGLSQLADHLGAHITTKELVDKPVEPTSGAHKVAQEVGSALGQLPALTGLYLASRFGLGRIAEDFTGSCSIFSRDYMAANSLAISGALYSGLTTKSREGEFVNDRLKATAIGGMTMYAMGRTQIRLQNQFGIAGTQMSAEIGTNLAQRGVNAALTTASGVVGGLVNAESNSLFYQHRMASAAELGTGAVKYGALGTVFGFGARIPDEPIAMPGKTGMRVIPRWVSGDELKPKSAKLDVNEGR
ncbi:MAG TPA: hypothetical protein V6C86_18035 [Oculatellaceae cyanobacterium]